jgi:hypothetical protein
VLVAADRRRGCALAPMDAANLAPAAATMISVVSVIQART